MEALVDGLPAVLCYATGGAHMAVAIVGFRQWKSCGLQLTRTFL